jgi:hypothetical protein
VAIDLECRGSDEQRHRFYEWMRHRMDRWETWGGLATRYGSERLTHHLLGVAVAVFLDDDAGCQINGTISGS